MYRSTYFLLITFLFSSSTQPMDPFSGKKKLMAENAHWLANKAYLYLVTFNHIPKGYEWRIEELVKESKQYHYDDIISTIKISGIIDKTTIPALEPEKSVENQI